jgi:hypothetical protein
MTTATEPHTTPHGLIRTDPESYELRFLDPKRTHVFHRTGLSRCTIADERTVLRVQVARAFPLSDTDHLIALLDGNGRDVGMIQDPSLMDEESQRTIDEDLAIRYFLPVVESILSVKEEFGTVYWKLQTDRGVHDAVARHLRENLMELPGGRVIITDVEGNRFEFPDIAALDARSMAIILRHL